MSLVEKFLVQVKKDPNKKVFTQLLPATEGSREYSKTDNQELLGKVKSLAKYLADLQVNKGTSIAIISNSRPEWLIADLGIMFAGGVSVSIYQTLTASEIAYILHDSRAEIVFAENEEQLDKLLEVSEKEFEIPAVEEQAAQKIKVNLRKIISFEEVEDYSSVVNLNSIISETQEFDAVRLEESDLASLVYTSGTTGPPKGVMQTHGNHLANIEQVRNSGIIDINPSIMLFLPLAHSFARLMGYLGLMTDCKLIFPSVVDHKTSKFDPQVITQDICDANAEVIPIVPRILEKMQQALYEKSQAKVLPAKLLRLTLNAAKNHYQNEGLLSKIFYALTASIRNKVRCKLFGENFQYGISGGAKLNTDTNTFFESLGIKILQGYGLTETCVATNVNRVNKNKIGTVGPVLDDSIEIKLTEDNEILFRGPNVSQGYINRPQATSEAWDTDSWFHTGDLGNIGPDGYLSIVGRKKELIVNSYGKKIAPNDIEDKIKSYPEISHAVLIGDGRPFCVALFTLVAETDRAAVQDIIDRVNKDLASYEQVKRFAILDTEFSIENGYLTPTLKLKRNLVEKNFASEIDSLYIS